MYKLKHFLVQELIPPDLYKDRGDVALIAMDDRILITIDRLREHFSLPITINNWHDIRVAKPFTQRGYRNDTGVGAPLSQHRFGRAVDMDISGVTAAAFRQMVKDGRLGGPGVKDSPLEFITRIEETNNKMPIGWIHADCGLQVMAAPVYHGIQFIQA